MNLGREGFNFQELKTEKQPKIREHYLKCKEMHQVFRSRLFNLEVRTGVLEGFMIAMKSEPHN